MDIAPGYDEVANFAEKNIAHPQRVIIAYHIRSGQYNAALEILAEELASSSQVENEQGTRTGVPELQMMIEHLRKIETPQEDQSFS